MGIALRCLALGLVLGIFFVNCYKNMQSHSDEDDTEKRNDSDAEFGLKQNNIAINLLPFMTSTRLLTSDIKLFDVRQGQSFYI